MNIRPSIVAIIGGGVSGTLMAVQLLRQALVPLQVLLFERMTGVGRGVAYGTENHEHCLNATAARMSALPDDPGHFLRWVESRQGQTGYPDRVAGGDYLPRWIYGDYIQTLLEETIGRAGPEIRCEVIKGEVADIETESGEVRLRCGDGRAFVADRVVLALGNLPGEYPIRRSLPVYNTQRYVHVPWRPGVLAGIAPEADVLVVGAGLTSVDIILDLAALGHRGVVHALSRRGLRPQVHETHPPYPAFFAAEPPPATILGLWRRLRGEVRRAGRQGIDWRPVLDAVRRETPAIWSALSWEERARFMRHVRPFWEIHRHRLAPAVAKKIEILRAAGRLRFYAGRLEALLERPDGVEARFRERGTMRRNALRVAKVINCTGPRSDYSKYQHPLLINLLARGLIDHDPLALGLNALPDGTVLGYRSGPVGWLFTLGAPLKGVLWECTAVPEISRQAQLLAGRILAG
ncbi:MAG TPA: FAD/NAD(P)-binding protein [Opitutaceae bacterium]|nr:FAD/NAD(P)-binding protein [Opitutaceae bacterium]